MKRHPALINLSQEHHGALVIGKKLKTAAQANNQSAITLWQSNRLLFLQELLAHFTEEEERFGALLEGELKQEFESDHAFLLHCLQSDAQLINIDVSSAQEATRRITAFADRLIQHVRFEERTLFPWLEQHHAQALKRL